MPDDTAVQCSEVVSFVRVALTFARPDLGFQEVDFSLDIDGHARNRNCSNMQPTSNPLCRELAPGQVAHDLASDVRGLEQLDRQQL